jgi:copper oxidase (laccase) domain-containing protein
MGTVSHIVTVAIQKMKNEYGNKTNRCKLPEMDHPICQDHYEVGEEVIYKAKASLVKWQSCS